MIQHIQILRLVAALAVVLHHARPPVIPTSLFGDIPTWLDGIARMGFVGVDIFFVISGAIMAETTRHLSSGFSTSLAFIRTRFLRIYTGWWPFFFVYLIAQMVTRGTLEEKNIAASFFLLPQSINSQLLPIVWTLCFELYFYLVLGLLLTLKRRHIILALMLIGLSLSISTTYFWITGLYTPARFGEVSILHEFYIHPLILEFIAGFIVCELIRKKAYTNWYPWATAGIGLAALATWYHLDGALSASGLAGFHHAPERVILVGGASCCLVACALMWKPRDNPINRLLEELGNSSYTIYLSHIAGIYAVCLIAQRLNVMHWLSTISLITLCTLAILAYSWLHYRLIERPLYNKARGIFFNQKI